MSAPEPSPGDVQAVPEARVAVNPMSGAWQLGHAMWLVTLFCLVGAVLLVWRSSVAPGLQIGVHFSDGHGIKTGDAVRFRGIQVGQVEDVALDAELQGVDVTIRLHPGAISLAREGSQFWVERPALSLGRMSGLETVVGAKFIGVLPGASDGSRAVRFTGTETPPRLRDANGTTVRIRFSQGHGLQPGDAVKYRGMIVGEVTDVRLDESLRQILVEARLVSSAESLARNGTEFWVERPEFSLQGIRGLDTILAGRYLSALPDPESRQPQTEFIGADEPPAIFDTVPGGLVVQIVAPHRFDIERGSVITFRGVPAGRVTWVGLASNGHQVELFATLDPEFARLVCEETRFWLESGLDLRIGLRGVDLNVEPLSRFLASRIAFATPNTTGAPVRIGHRFELLRQEPEGWRDWKPEWPQKDDAGASDRSAAKRQSMLERLKKKFQRADRP